MSKDIFHNTLAEIGLNIQTFASDTDTNGNIIDMQNFESGKVVLALGTLTAGDIAIKEIQESDASDMTGATVIPADRIFGAITALDTANTKTELGFHQAKRYIRPVFTTDNTATALVAGAIVEKGEPHTAPTQ